MVGVLMCSSLPRLTASDWRKSDTAVVTGAARRRPVGRRRCAHPVTIAKPPLGTGIGREPRRSYVRTSDPDESYTTAVVA